MGSQFFQKVQYGKESAGSRGTAVAATKIFVGQAPKVVSDSKPEYPVEQFGQRAQNRRGIVQETLYQNSLISDHAGFEQMALMFGCGLVGNITPSEQTTGKGDYLWTFTPSLIAANNPDSCTLEYGDDAQAWRSAYCMFDKITIKGDIKQDGSASPVSVEGSFFGRAIGQNAFTAALSSQKSQPMNSKLAQLFVDTTWAGVGGTELANLLRGFEIQIMTGVHPDFAGSSASTAFTAHKEGLVDYSATFTIEGGASAAAALIAQQAQSLVVARLKITGPLISAGSQPFSLTVDMGGTWQSISPIASSDREDNLGTLGLNSIYDDTGAKALAVALSVGINAY